MSWMICPICRGEGSYVNPNIDSHGISAEEMHEDPDFAEDYFAGVYNVPCSTCSGSGKLKTEEWEEKEKRLEEAAQDRKTRMYEDGVYQPGVMDYRYGED